MEYNITMLAYDVPLSALFFIVYAGVPAKNNIGPTEEQLDEYIAMLKRIQDYGL
jgi:hypothetical protein